MIKKILILVLIVAAAFLFCGNSYAKTYYVSITGSDSNNGESWDRALLNIKTALAKTASEDSVWVAAGTYIEGETLIIQTGVSLYGGFAGSETDISQRNIDANKTIINGNNSYRCVRSWGVVDGFEITNGKADKGAGAYNEAGKIENCKIYSNTATDSGGGIYSFYGVNINCKIYSNSASSLGGGIASDFGHVINCKIYSNSANNGGGYHNNQGSGWDCEVYSNYAERNGGGIRTINGSIENCIVYNNSTSTTYEDSYAGGIDVYKGTVANCKIYSNSSKNGGGLFNNQGDINNNELYSNTATFSGGGLKNIDGTVKNCKFYSNSASGTSATGGGIIIYDGLITQCEISSNYASSEGGGIFNYYGEVNNTLVFDNSSDFRGGGIYTEYGKIMNCSVYSNHSERGGGIENYDGTISNCKVYLNSAERNGGGICSFYDNITNSALYSNSAGDSGGGIYSYYGNIINCSIYSNAANNVGGGAYVDEGSVSNCIIWNNKNAGDVYLLNDVEISFSCFGEATPSGNNIKANPMFENTSGDFSTWNFHLRNGSPCIDRGTQTKAPTTDIEGNPRPGGDGKSDMGAYESSDSFLPGTPLPSRRFYVSKTGDNTDGLSWNTAYTSINEAIYSAGDDFFDIWISEGNYNEGSTVFIPGRSSLFGGFAGYETSLEDRDTSANLTIIDGNSGYRCVFNEGIIDGFHIKNGKSLEYGGGVYNYFGEIINSKVYSNSGYSGGGVLNSCGTVSRCDIYSNISSGWGGGIDNYYGTMNNCNVYSNSAGYGGGGINDVSGKISNCSVYKNLSYYNGGGILSKEGKIKNCVIYSNSSDERNHNYGGGISINQGEVTNCVLFSNSANSGGGILLSSSTMSNCKIYSNSAKDDGGGVCASSGYIYNSLLHSNSANNGGGIYQQYYGGVTFCTLYSNTASEKGGGSYNSSSNIRNSIIWNNEAGGDVYLETESSKISYSCFGEADDSNGNRKAEPLFANTSGDSSTWDFHLQPSSPCIDKGTSSAYSGDDIEGRMRPWGEGFDMGAYEYGSHFRGDINMDDKIDLMDADILKKYLLAKTTLNPEQLIIADFKYDSMINIADIVLMMNEIEK